MRYALTALTAAVLLLAGCGGDSVDEAARTMDKAADNVRDSAEDAAEAAERHAEDVQEQLDRATGDIQ